MIADLSVVRNYVLTPAFQFLFTYLDMPTATGLPDGDWEEFQWQHLDNRSTFSITRKSRQIGWSWLAAAESVAKGKLTPRHNSIFVSINLDEAQEKIRYAKQIIEGLPPSKRPRLLVDNASRLEFMNGSRIISHPCTPVRGKPQSDVYLDEFAHYVQDRKIYTSAIPVISRGGHMRIGSSSFGASGMFWDIVTETMQPYPGYMRFYVPWWVVNSFCNNSQEATLLAPEMNTEERVLKYGKPRLIEIYLNMVLDDFQQEYECAWVDETVAWIDWELIRANTAKDQDGKLEYIYARDADTGLKAIENLFKMIEVGKCEQVLVGGYDVGRTHDKSELIVLGKSTSQDIPYRLGITLDRTKFERQEDVLNKLMQILPVVYLAIDQNGIGMQLAENLQRRWGARIIKAVFTNENKALWAVEGKLRFQKHAIPIPANRDLMYQIHSLKRKLTESKNVVFDVSDDAEDKHHADKAWALFLAAYGAKSLSNASDWIRGVKKQQAQTEEHAEYPGRPLQQKPITTDWAESMKKRSEAQTAREIPAQRIDRNKILPRKLRG